MAAISKKYDGILLVRQSASGVRESRIISSTSSVLMNDLDATERMLVNEALSTMTTAPACSEVWYNGSVGCVNNSCVGTCFPDFLVAGDSPGSVKRVRSGTATFDLGAAPTPSVVICSCAP